MSGCGKLAYLERYVLTAFGELSPSTPLDGELPHPGAPPPRRLTLCAEGSAVRLARAPVRSRADRSQRRGECPPGRRGPPRGRGRVVLPPPVAGPEVSYQVSNNPRPRSSADRAAASGAVSAFGVTPGAPRKCSPSRGKAGKGLRCAGQYPPVTRTADCQRWDRDTLGRLRDRWISGPGGRGRGQGRSAAARRGGPRAADVGGGRGAGLALAGRAWLRPGPGVVEAGCRRRRASVRVLARVSPTYIPGPGTGWVPPTHSPWSTVVPCGRQPVTAQPSSR